MSRASWESRSSADAREAIVAIIVLLLQATQIGRVLDAEAVGGHVGEVDLWMEEGEEKPRKSSYLVDFHLIFCCAFTKTLKLEWKARDKSYRADLPAGSAYNDPVRYIDPGGRRTASA